jgi:pterin-4a-carbinolamine dehydratase
MATDLFISYRRQDATAYAMCLRLAMEKEFGEKKVFMDTSSIDPGAEFPDDLNRALGCAQVMLAVIGKQWLSSADEYGRRRLDSARDWVRREIEIGLGRPAVRVIPVLVGGAGFPAKEALPESMAALPDRTMFELRESSLEADLKRLVDFLRSLFGVESPAPAQMTELPVPPLHVPQKLDVESLKTAMRMIPKWVIETSPLRGKPEVIRTELMREFKFETFVGALDFMHRIGPQIDAMEHHPRWENLWKTVTVWLTTWDIGHEISDRDIVLARFLDHAYVDWQSPKKSKGQTWRRT